MKKDFYIHNEIEKAGRLTESIKNFLNMIENSELLSSSINTMEHWKRIVEKTKNGIISDSFDGQDNLEKFIRHVSYSVGGSKQTGNCKYSKDQWVFDSLNCTSPVFNNHNKRGNLSLLLFI